MYFKRMDNRLINGSILVIKLNDDGQIDVKSFNKGPYNFHTTEVCGMDNR